MWWPIGDGKPRAAGGRQDGMRHLPIFMRLESRRALVVGGGAVAAARVRHLLAAGAAVAVIAPEGVEDGSEIAGFAARGEIALARRAFRPSDLDGSAIAFAAAGDDSADDSADDGAGDGLDSKVSRAARDAGVPVNVADRADLSTFIMPAIVDRNPILIGISTGGAAPVLAREVRARIDRLLPADLGRLAGFAESFRGAVKATIGGKEARRRFWENFFDSETARLVLRGEMGAAAAGMLSLVNRGARQTPDGIVHFVGAGPGDADLLTIRAHRHLLRADVVIHDQAIDGGILNMTRREAERFLAGADGTEHAMGRNEIVALMIERARRGQRVVRLKRGDSMMFASGDAECASLIEAGIRVELVPGVTAAADAAEAPPARAVAS